MPRKVILVTDPGLDGAFAVALALHDPEVDVLGLAATAGNVPGEQATRNVHTLVEQIDPPRWPRLGAALPVEYEVDATRLHGPNGLGGIEFPVAQLHHPHPSDKLICDLVRLHPKEVTVVVLGPATVLARAMDRDPDLAGLVRRLVVVGGTWHEPGDAGPVSEFHFFCDPAAARQVLRCGAPLTLLPLDVTRKLVLSPSDLLDESAAGSRAGQFLRKVAPPGVSATAGLYGTEGLYLQDVLGVVAVTQPELFSVRAVAADVETRGDLTRGTTVFDVRWGTPAKPNVDLATTVDAAAARRHLTRTLGQQPAAE